jgi:hypothetical protein
VLSDTGDIDLEQIDDAGEQWLAIGPTETRPAHCTLSSPQQQQTMPMPNGHTPSRPRSSAKSRSVTDAHSFS